MIVTSVVIPVRNGAGRIAAAIDSALREIAPSDEIIVVDDGSTDATIRTIEPYLPRVRLIAGPGHGPSVARNLGLAAATGSHVAFLDHDDLWPAGRQAALVGALGPQPDGTTAAHGRTLITTDDGWPPEAYAAMHGAHLNWQIMSMLCPIGLVRDVGGFAEDMRYGEDIDLGLRLLEAGMKLLQVDADVWIYRRHAVNASNDTVSAYAGQGEALRRRVQRMRARQ